MPVALSALKPGDVVFDVRREQAGNTTRRRLSCWEVRILEVHPEEQAATVSWNGNPPRRARARDGKFPWRRTRPTLGG